MAETKTADRSTRAITGSLGSSQRDGYLAALNGGKHNPEGYSLSEFHIRYVATGAPLWNKMPGIADLNWFVRNGPGKAGGEIYRIFHEEGVKTVVAENDKKFSVKSKGDEVRRWLYVGPTQNALVETAGSDMNAVSALAESMLTKHIAGLMENGMSREDIENIPSIKRMAELGLRLRFTGTTPAKKKTTAAAKSNTTPRAAREKSASAKTKKVAASTK